MAEERHSVGDEDGSFRDPGSRVFHYQGQIIRGFDQASFDEFRHAENSGLLASLIETQKLVAYDVIEPGAATFDGADGFDAFLRHPKIPFISYPYEWSHTGLKTAALFFLDLLTDALAHDVRLSDATAFNVQFNGTQPIFIDHGSFGKYRDGEPWLAHQQFCDHFLAPLALQSTRGVVFNDWYRGHLDGLKTHDVAAMLPWRSWLSLGALMHLILPSWLDRRAVKGGLSSKRRLAKPTKVSKASQLAFIAGVRRYVSSLSLRGAKTTWSDYESDNSYSDRDTQEKAKAIAEFAGAIKPERFVDIGCNSGKYSEIMLLNGAATGIGLEGDPVALDRAFNRAQSKNLNLLPLYQDLVNPTPAQGWANSERKSLSDRLNADAIIALAVIHHIVFTGKVPLPRAIEWLVQMAPNGLVEFVPPDDPMVEELTSRGGVKYHPYSEDMFRRSLSKHARILDDVITLNSGRILFRYERI